MKCSARSIGAITSFCMVLCCSLSAAHNLETVGTQSNWRPARLALMPGEPSTLKPRPEGLGPVVESVFVFKYQWPVGQVLHVCFLGGDEAVRQRVIAAAQPWFTAGASIMVDAGTQTSRTCVSHDTSEIRISFDEPGYWSYIGTQNRQQLIDQGLSTLNLEAFDSQPPDEPRFSGIVLHEFGHAIGFHHEHQSPGNECADTVDWGKLITYYHDHYGWDEAKTRYNLEPLAADRRAYDWSAFDPDSIMIYASNRQFLVEGTPDACIFHDNNALSSQDKTGLLKAYPVVADNALENNARAAMIDVILRRGVLAQDASTVKALSTQRDLLQRAYKRADAAHH